MNLSSFYENRIKWCHKTASSYDGPSNISQIGLRGMTIAEFSEPNYFPWDEDRFEEVEAYHPTMQQFLECLLLPLGSKLRADDFT